MLNKVMLIGRLTRDVELRTTQSGKYVASASLATSETWTDSSGQKQKKTEFHNLTIWNGSENFSKYLSKGSLVYVEGKLQTEEFEKDGVKIKSTKINVSNFSFLESKKEEHLVKDEQGKVAVEEVSEDDEDIKVENIPF